jgi:hypothetical protein
VIPEPIAQLQRQLDRIRSTRPRGRKLPESVWVRDGIHTVLPGQFDRRLPLRLALGPLIGGSTNLTGRASRGHARLPKTHDLLHVTFFVDRRSSLINLFFVSKFYKLVADGSRREFTAESRI